MTALGAIHLVAAQKQLTEETVRPGLIGLFFFVALFVALYFLWRSMNKQLKKADAHFAAEDANIQHFAAEDANIQHIAAEDANIQHVAAEDAAAAEAAGVESDLSTDGPDATGSAGEGADR